MGMGNVDGLKAKLDDLIREQAERRALLEQLGKEIKESSHKYMTEQAQTAERYVMHRRELGRRAAEGRGTTQPESDAGSAFEPEANKAENGSVSPAPFTPTNPNPVPQLTGRPERPVAPRRTRRASADELDDDADAFLNNRWRD
jgi:hypothetical protein